MFQVFPAGFVPPCLPTFARIAPEGPHWVYEIKHDGFRFMCRRDGDRVRVFSRNARDWADRVPAIVEAMRALPLTSATIDGEGVVCDDRGVADFERLRAGLAERGGSRANFVYAFDLLEADEDVRRHRPVQFRPCVSALPVEGTAILAPLAFPTAGLQTRGFAMNENEKKFPCAHCRGGGKFGGQDCRECEGKGYVVRRMNGETRRSLDRPPHGRPRTTR